MNEDNWFIIACLLAAPVVGFLFIAAWVKKKTCVTGTDFIMEQGNFLRGLWTILPESHACGRFFRNLINLHSGISGCSITECFMTYSGGAIIGIILNCSMRA